MTSNNVITRPATPADAAAMGQLGELLVRMHHDFDPQRFLEPTPQTAQGYGAFLGRQIGEPDAIIIVAERDGNIIGYAYGSVEGYDYMSLRGPAGALQDIVVDPAYRRQGVGRMLLDAIIAALEARGVPRTLLSTAVRNEAAQRLFASVGFRPTMIEMTKETTERG
jgi:ribosomal protein S18 acetylase RimI-like enzyme